MTTYERGTAYAYVTCTPTGDDTNGGCWGGQQSGNGVDRSLDDSPHVVIDGSTITAEITSRTTLELDGHTVHNDDCGNGCRLYSATTGTYFATGPITSVDTGDNSWTIQSQHGPWNGATGQFVTGAMGGACATPGEAASRTAAYAACYVKAGTYTLTSNASDVPGGRPALIAGTTMSAFKTTPGDHLANASDRVVLLRGSTTNNGAMIDDAGGYRELVCGFDIDCDDEWEIGTDVNMAINCTVRNATGNGYECDQAFTCAAHDCAGYGFYDGHFIECAAYDCANGLYALTSFRSLAHGCAGYGFYMPRSAGSAFNVADNCGTGFFTNARSMSGWNMATNCTTGGEGNMPGLAVAYNNTANWDNMTEVSGGIDAALQLTADPYEDASGEDFRINDTAGGGSELENFAPKWAAGSVSGPQEQFAAILKSSGGGSSVIPARPIQIGA